MRSYMHRNSSIEPPTLNEREYSLYMAIKNNVPLELNFAMAGAKYIPEMLHNIADRIQCDIILDRLLANGIQATIVHRQNEIIGLYSEVAIRFRDDYSVAVDAEAAERILQRVQCGLSIADAIDRTMDQCDQPTLTEEQLLRLERECDVNERRLDLGHK